MREQPSRILLTLTLTRLRVRERPSRVLLSGGRVVVQLEELVALVLVLLGASSSRQHVVCICGTLCSATSSADLSFEVKKCRDSTQRDVWLLLVGTSYSTSQPSACRQRSSARRAEEAAPSETRTRCPAENRPAAAAEAAMRPRRQEDAKLTRRQRTPPAPTC